MGHVPPHEAALAGKGSAGDPEVGGADRLHVLAELNRDLHRGRGRDGAVARALEAHGGRLLVQPPDQLLRLHEGRAVACHVGGSAVPEAAADGLRLGPHAEDPEDDEGGLRRQSLRRLHRCVHGVDVRERKRLCQRLRCVDQHPRLEVARRVEGGAVVEEAEHGALGVDGPRERRRLARPDIAERSGGDDQGVAPVMEARELQRAAAGLARSVVELALIGTARGRVAMAVGEAELRHTARRQRRRGLQELRQTEAGGRR
uniref:Uncharacterized protein n=1 Tax=Tetraselmis sp. GSL018 TaxID=582737 RepID=A0A061RBU7_9CHLO